jgi:hypothetical protein
MLSQLSVEEEREKEGRKPFRSGCREKAKSNCQLGREEGRDRGGIIPRDDFASAFSLRGKEPFPSIVKYYGEGRQGYAHTDDDEGDTRGDDATCLSTKAETATKAATTPFTHVPFPSFSFAGALGKKDD